MSSAEPKTGVCRICGVLGKLTYEHVPPRAAFNDRSVLGFGGKVLFEHGLDPDRNLGTFSQRGAGAFTLCAKCNNDTGSWYGPRYIEWCFEGMRVLLRSDGKPTLMYLNGLYPLSIVKQVVAMFFSVNGEQFSGANRYLVNFVLDRERKHLPPDIRIYAYYSPVPVARSVGVSGHISGETGNVRVLSEISHPPFGYVMTFGSLPPDRRLTDISHFADYDYTEAATFNITLPVLETHLPLPGDYRTRPEIRRDELINEGFTPPDV